MASRRKHIPPLSPTDSEPPSSPRSPPDTTEKPAPQSSQQCTKQSCEGGDAPARCTYCFRELQMLCPACPKPRKEADTLTVAKFLDMCEGAQERKREAPKPSAGSTTNAKKPTSFKLLKKKPVTILWKFDPDWGLTDEQRDGKLARWDDDTLGELVTKVKETNGHTATLRLIVEEAWDEVCEGMADLNPRVKGLHPGLCRLQYEWLMKEFRTSGYDRYGQPTSDVFAWFSPETMSLLSQLKTEEDELEASYSPWSN